jgi:flagellar biosynthesis protein FliR
VDDLVRQFELWVVILARTSSFVFLMPVLGNRTVPTMAKIGVSGFLAFFLISASIGRTDLPSELLPFFLIILREVLVGLTLGFVTMFLFAGISMMGEVAGIQMGFGMAQIFDPSAEAQLNLLGEFYSLMSLVLFLLLDGHHVLLRGFTQSYRVIPIVARFPNTGVLRQLIESASGIFSSAIQIGAPILVALFLTEAVLGIMARTAPQMNVLVVGLPLKLGVGFCIIMLTLSLYQRIFERLWSGFVRDFAAFIKLF